jgi:hypothetical protein
MKMRLCVIGLAAVVSGPSGAALAVGPTPEPVKPPTM